MLVVNNYKAKHAKSFAPPRLVGASPLLQLSPSPLSDVILTSLMVDKLIAAIAISLVPYKSPCWCLASFTPDVMQSVIRTPIALGNRHKRKYLLSTSFILAYEASVAGSRNSTHQHTSTEILVSVFPYRSPHWMFPSLQHKVICRLSLTIRLRKSISLLLIISSASSVRSTSAWLMKHLKSLPSFVQHLHSYNWVKFKTHTFAYK